MHASVRCPESLEPEFQSEVPRVGINLKQPVGTRNRVGEEQVARQVSTRDAVESSNRTRAGCK
jgi:hypothetical protein